MSFVDSFAAAVGIKKKIDSAQSSINGNLTNATNGLGAIKTAVDSANSDLTDATYGLAQIKNDTDLLTNNTYGLSALKNQNDTIENDLIDGTNGLAAIKSAITSANSELTSNSYGLSQIKNDTDTLNNGSYGLSSIKSGVDTANNTLDNQTYGLQAIKNAISSSSSSPIVRVPHIYIRQLDANDTFTDSLRNLVSVTGKGVFNFAVVNTSVSKTSWNKRMYLAVILDGKTVFIYDYTLTTQPSNTTATTFFFGVYAPDMLYCTSSMYIKTYKPFPYGTSPRPSDIALINNSQAPASFNFGNNFTVDHCGSTFMSSNASAANSFNGMILQTPIPFYNSLVVRTFDSSQTLYPYIGYELEES